MSDLPPPPENPPWNPQPPPFSDAPPPPGYVPYGQHRGLQVVFAGFWIRFLALLIDSILLGVAVGMVGSILDLESGGARLLNIAVGVLYYASLEGGPTGQTVGKKICGIRVVDAETGVAGIGFGRGVGRYFARWLSAIPLGLGYFWMLWDPRNQCWQDKLVNDLVVKG